MPFHLARYLTEDAEADEQATQVLGLWMEHARQLERELAAMKLLKEAAEERHSKLDRFAADLLYAPSAIAAGETPRTNALADRYGDIDPDSPYWAALDLATELERETFSLAAGLCLHGLKGDEGGTPYCPRIRELEQGARSGAGAADVVMVPRDKHMGSLAPLKVGDYVRVRYKDGHAYAKGEITRIWELPHPQAQINGSWCFHDGDEIVEHTPAAAEEGKK